MANSDYVIRSGNGPLCPNATIVGALAQLTSVVTIENYSSPTRAPIRIGSAAFLNEEIISILGINGNEYTIGRGCCDTVPAAHAAGSMIWFFDDFVNSDGIEYAAGEMIAVKPLPRTPGGVQVAVEDSPPVDLTFNWRFARPYPPAWVDVNASPWFVPMHMDSLYTEMSVSWVHRDRIVQQDVLLAHKDFGLSAPEPGTTYSIEIFDSACVSKALFTGITGTTFTYTRLQAKAAFAVVSGVHAGHMVLQSIRDGYESWQNYRIDFTFDASP